MTPHRKAINAFNTITEKRQEIETVDGRTFYSDDNWQTVYLVTRDGKPRQITGKTANLARFLAIHID